MAIPITVPRLGWNMDQGVFVGWLKSDGAAVRAGEPLFTLESEKATEDIAALDDGILHVPADGPDKGDVVAVGAVIGFVLQPDEPIPTLSKPSPPPQPREPIAAETRAPTMKAGPRHRPASSPRARRTAAKLGIDWRNAKPSGRSGRIRERDVLALTASVPSLRRVIAERMMTSHRLTAPVTLTRTIDATELVNLRKRWKAAPPHPTLSPRGGRGLGVGGK
jgi:pyruvate dehydrogenase E2 component (dihydrolipoamide acetyltransferase)